MDWTQTFTIIGVFSAFLAYLLVRMDNLDKKFESKFEAMDAKFESKFDTLSRDIARLDAKISNIEGQITQMTRPTKIIRLDKDLCDDQANEN